MITGPEQLRARTRSFAVRIIRLFRALPNNREAQVIGTQLLRSGTSVAANYHAACGSRSRTEFIAKLGTVAEEADESIFWLELLVETGMLPLSRLHDLLCGANELTAIFAVARRSSRGESQITHRRSQIANG